MSRFTLDSELNPLKLLTCFLLLGSFLAETSFAQLLLPENAQLNMQGNGLVCRSGFKQVRKYCKQMTMFEAQLQLIEPHKSHLLQGRNQSHEYYLEDEGINLSEISRNCEVYRYDENYGELDCNDYDLVEIERNCEVYFANWYEREGELECGGSDYSELETSCSVYMYSYDYGEIEC